MRHRIALADLTHPQDLPRLPDLGVVAAIQPGLLISTQK